jgi:hypothetical protein
VLSGIRVGRVAGAARACRSVRGLRRLATGMAQG